MEIQKLKKTIGRVSLIKDFGIILLVVMLINQFLFMNTVVPSASMEPTIMTGDRTFVTQIPYYYSDPKRGEIVVFNEDGVKMVKRVIGMPGDVIDIKDSQAYINGTPLDESHYLVPAVETLYEEMPYEVFGKLPYTIPEEHYFLMGDNRMDSMDSRAYGAVERKEIIARGSFRFYPFNKMGIIK